MEDLYLYLLLKVIKENKSIGPLIREGMSFKTIGNLLQQAAKENLVFIDNDEVALTDDGEGKYLILAEDFKKTNKILWIEPDDSARIPKLEKNFIYLPNQNELPF